MIIVELLVILVLLGYLIIFLWWEDIPTRKAFDRWLEAEDEDNAGF